MTGFRDDRVSLSSPGSVTTSPIRIYPGPRSDSKVRYISGNNKSSFLPEMSTEMSPKRLNNVASRQDLKKESRHEPDVRQDKTPTLSMHTRNRGQDTKLASNHELRAFTDSPHVLTPQEEEYSEDSD
jgi:hypothetical protein